MEYGYETGYRKGYFKALQDIHQFYYIHSDYLHHKTVRGKNLKVLIAVIKYLLQNRQARELFIRYGGDVKVVVKIDKKNIEIKEISDS